MMRMFFHVFLLDSTDLIRSIHSKHRTRVSDHPLLRLYFPYRPGKHSLFIKIHPCKLYHLSDLFP